jgi:hypothetical protein
VAVAVSELVMAGATDGSTVTTSVLSSLPPGFEAWRPIMNCPTVANVPLMVSPFAVSPAGTLVNDRVGAGLPVAVSW